MQVKTTEDFLLKCICFLVPATIAFQVDVGSQIFLAELILPCVAAIVFLRRRVARLSRDLSLVMKIGCAYFLCQFASDLWNETLYEQYSRGWARILLFLLNLASIYIIVNNNRSRLILFCLGFALGRVWITFAGLEGDVIPWKIGLAKPVAMLVILLCVVLPMSVTSRSYVSALALACLGLFDILMDFRSHGSVLLLASMILLTSTFIRKQPGKRPTMRLHTALGLLLGVTIAGLAASEFYRHAATSGWLSENATNKFKMQVEDADAPLIIAGRSEVLVYFEAIFDSILIGHGSWPRNAYYADMLAERRFDRGLSNSPAQAADDAIPLHSHIFGSWIEAGLVGGLFWANILLLIVRSLLRSSEGRSELRPLYLYGAMLLAWDILFSPFSGFRRLETALLLVILLRSLLQRQPQMLSRRFMKFRRSRTKQGLSEKQRRRVPLRSRRRHRSRSYQPV